MGRGESHANTRASHKKRARAKLRIKQYNNHICRGSHARQFAYYFNIVIISLYY